MEPFTEREWNTLWSDVDSDPFKCGLDLFPEFDANFAKKLAMEADMDYVQARGLVRNGAIDNDLYKLLTDEQTYGLEPKRAATITQHETIQQFDTRVQELECFVGNGAAVNIIQKGEFPDYFNGRNDVYMGLVREAAGKLGHTISEKDVHHFYSIRSLQTYLHAEQGNDKFNITNLDVSAYRILYKSDEQAVSFLNGLIEEGQFSIGHTEFWRCQGGPRGGHVIQCIKDELKCIFRDLGLPTPQITDGNYTLYIGEDVQESLRQIRDKVYAQVARRTSD